MVDLDELWSPFSLTKKRKEETGETIGKLLRTVVLVADLEDDGFGSEFLQVRVTMDITKPLTRCSKLWADGKQIDPVISGASQSQAPWWRKQNGPLKKLGNQPGNTAPEQPQDDNGSSGQRIANHREVLEHECGLEADVASLKIVDGVVNSLRKDAFGPYSVPLTDITNRGNLDSALYPITKNGKERIVMLSQLP
nr:hypothetical protein CFP56_77813 [Quercus suber]